MSCEDIPSLLDLQKVKKHADDFGRLMGTGTGTSTNEVTGQVRPTYNAVMSNLGYTRIGTFASGATLLNGRQTLLWDIADGGDGQEYGWSGVFPKVVPATSTPASTGGISIGAWISRFDPELRIQVREALRRSYAEAGYTLVDGSFEAGGTLVNANDVLLQERTGKAFSGLAGNVPAGTNPVSGGFVDRSGVLLRDYANVRGFGALGDGVTDDTAAFALANSMSELDIYVPCGTYILAGLTISKRFYGPGTLKWKAESTTPMVTLTGENARLDGLAIDGNASAQNANAAAISFNKASAGEVVRCRITNVRYKVIVSDVAMSPRVVIKDNCFVNCGIVSGCDVVGIRSPNWSVSGNKFHNIGDGHCVRLGLLNGDPTGTPVSGASITGNIFNKTQHVGVTCEIYSNNISISGNIFDDLKQGVKMEQAGNTVHDIAITGNTFKNLTAQTAMNLQGSRVTFVGNVCTDNSGVCDIGGESICSDNIFSNCGSSSIETIRVTGVFSKTIISGNRVINSPFRGIAVGADCVCTGNIVTGAVDRSISASSATRAVITNNTTDGGTYGIITNSSTTDAVITGNICRNASVSNYSVGETDTTFIDASNIGYMGRADTKAIVSNAITAPRRSNCLIIVDTEGGSAADDLSTVNVSGGGIIGQLLMLRSASSSRLVTIKDGSNLRLEGDFILNSINDVITLVYTGTQWYEIARSNNG